MNSLRIFTLACILLPLWQLVAQQDRDLIPPPGPAPAVSFPEFTESTLDNGLTVFVVTNTSQPLVSFRLMIKSGTEYDEPHSGIANFVADLMTSGTSTRTSQQFASEADFKGLHIGADASDDQMTLSGSGLKKHMHTLLDLMSDALYNPSFPVEELDKLKKQSISGLKTVRRNPDAVMERLKATVGFGGHPYSNFALEEDVEAITREDVVAFHKRYFIPNNSSIAVVGDVTAEEILPVIEQYFGTWKAGETPRRDFSAPDPITDRTVHLVDLGSTQTQTAISVLTTGIRRDDADVIPLSILNSILGGGFSGRLFMNLRETHGFTYGAYSDFTLRKDAGVWSAAANVRRSATDSAFTQIMYEIERMRNEPVPDDELDMHKQSAAGRFLLSLERPSTIAFMVQNIDLYDLPKDYYRKYVGNIMAVTSADVQQLARKYFSVANLALLAVGDAGSVASKLEAFGPVRMYDADMKPASAVQFFDVDMDAETLMEKSIAAMGGREKLLSIHSRVTEAELSVEFGAMHAEGSMTLIEKAPNKSHEKMVFSMDFGGGEQTIESETWVDGINATVRAPMYPARSLSGDELREALEQAEFNAMARWKELGYEVTVLEKKVMDERTVYVVEMKRKHSTEQLIIDADSFLLVGRIEEVDSPTGPTSRLTKIGDYRTVDGMQLPHSMQSDGDEQSMRITVRSYQHNSDIPDSVFEHR